MGPLGIFLAVLALVVIWLAYLYNSLVSMRNRVDESWSDIDVQLKRRYDLIPNLVNTVKAYAKHEDQVFTKVTEARNVAMNATDPEAKAKAENVLAGTLKSLFAVAEAYPDLKASQNFMELQDELTDTENKVQASRRFYNGNVRDFNTKLQVFPNNLVARLFGFIARKFFEIEEPAQKENVQVTF